jgi:predicted Fe-Mo cluster-binding NifX family protein
MGNSLDAPVDPRFGRCVNFIIVDTETMQFTIQPNPGMVAGQGAGIQAAQILSERGVQAVVAGNFGPNAFQVLSAAGIRVFQGISGTVGQAVEQLKSGVLPEVKSATVASHFGTGQGFQPGARMGLGGRGRARRGSGGNW